MKTADKSNLIIEKAKKLGAKFDPQAAILAIANIFAFFALAISFIEDSDLLPYIAVPIGGLVLFFVAAAYDRFKNASTINIAIFVYLAAFVIYYVFWKPLYGYAALLSLGTPAAGAFAVLSIYMLIMEKRDHLLLMKLVNYLGFALILLVMYIAPAAFNKAWLAALFLYILIAKINLVLIDETHQRKTQRQ